MNLNQNENGGNDLNQILSSNLIKNNTVEKNSIAQKDKQYQMKYLGN